MKLHTIAEKLGGAIIGDGNVSISQLDALDTAEAGSLSFILEQKFIKKGQQSNASAFITFEEINNLPVQIVVKNPRKALAETIQLFSKETTTQAPIIAKTSTIHPSAVIGNNCTIGENTVIHPNVVLYDNCHIGNNCMIHAGTVIGSDGFGYYQENKKWHKMPHIGKVIIHDDVEIGANCTIDRGCIGDTIINDGTKIDNLVHIAHNLVIGRHCAIAAQVGFTGSTTLKNNIMIGGQAGIDASLIEDNCIITAKAGVTKDLEKNAFVSGFPAWDHRKELLKEAKIRKMVTQRRKK